MNQLLETSEIGSPVSKERVKILGELEAKKQKNSNFSYAATQHFAVSYSSEDIYKDFGSWSEKDPKAIAEFLEIGLRQVTDRFQLNPRILFNMLT